MTREEIITAASRMTNTYDLLALLNRIKKDELGDKAHEFTLQQLHFFINPKRNITRYRTFTIPKKAGGVRTIAAPVRLLKSFQTYMNRILQAFYEAPDCVTGFVPGRSVVDNAEQHIGQYYVLNIDLKDFFPSISQARVWGTLKARPFSFPENIASAIAGLCCIQEEIASEDSKTAYRYVLPQGSPCSPVLTNIVCHNLDWKLGGLARRFNLRYSRYADDITFSSPHNVYQDGGEFMTELRRIITEQNFTINEAKTRLQKRGARQEVTGLVVSDRVNVTRDYVRELDNLLYIWERHGHRAAHAKFLVHYQPKQNRFSHQPQMENVLQGKLMYLRMVKGEQSPVWRRLQKRFNRLMDRKESAGGTDVIYKDIYRITDFEKAFETTLLLYYPIDGQYSAPSPHFAINGNNYPVGMSKYVRTRLGNILSNGDEALVQKFKEKFFIAFCQTEKHPDTHFWMLTRGLPKKSTDDAVSDILGMISEIDKVSAPPSELLGASGLSTDEMLSALIDSDFDLKTLEQWEKIKRNN